MKHSRRFLEWSVHNFLTKMIKDSTRRGTVLGLILKKKKKEELAGDVQVRGSTVCTDREIVVFRILRGGDHRPALQEIRFQLLHVEKITAWKNYMPYSPAEKTSPEQLADIQVPASPSSGKAHPQQVGNKARAAGGLYG